MQRRRFLHSRRRRPRHARRAEPLRANAAEPPIRLVVGFPPGGGADALARVVAQKLTTLWNQQVIVENKAGASGTLAAEFVAQQPADGGTLLLTTINSHALAPAVQPKLRYHPERDFTPVVLLGVTPNVLIAGASNPVKTVKELWRCARRSPAR